MSSQNHLLITFQFSEPSLLLLSFLNFFKIFLTDNLMSQKGHGRLLQDEGYIIGLLTHINCHQLHIASCSGLKQGNPLHQLCALHLHMSLFTRYRKRLCLFKQFYIKMLFIIDVTFASGIKKKKIVLTIHRCVYKHWILSTFLSPVKKMHTNRAIPTVKTQDSNCLQLPGNFGGLVGKTLLLNCKGRGFESHPSNMPVILPIFTRLGKVPSIQCLHTLVKG